MFWFPNSNHMVFSREVAFFFLINYASICRRMQLRHVSMAAKFLDDNKPIKLLKSLFALFQTSPILFNLIHFIWQILAKFSLGPYLSLSKLRKKKSDNFCVLFTYSITRAREIRTFHVAVVQRRQRNVQNSVIDVKSCCLLI